MRIEAFSEAKDPARPGANEDALLILPGRAFAVIDGVSDRTGVRYDGMLAGQYASTLVRRRLETILGDEGVDVVADLTATIAAAYDRLGVRAAVEADWGGKIASTLALVLVGAERVEAILVGDSGLRINGTELHRDEKDLDRITSLLRRAAWHHAEARGIDRAGREVLSRALAFRGAAQDPAPEGFFAADLAAIADAAMAACVADLPHLPRAVIAPLIAHGIVGAQGAHQNNDASPLGYSCLDGFAIPERFITRLSWPRAEVRTIELFTDGYFDPAAGFGVEAWEAAFRAAEAEDPAKIGRFLSPRGSTATTWADDRTYLGVALDSPG